MTDVWTISLLAAAIPTAAYVLLIWWCDRYEKEPLWLLLAAFVWGAVPAVLLALGGESLLDPSPAVFSTYLGRRFVSGSVIAPLVEETAKGLALLLIFLALRDEFDGPLDGIIYGALIGFGFAMTENSFYLSRELMWEGWISFGVLAFLRTIPFGFNHAFFSAFAGVGLGIARSTRRKAVKWLAPLLGLVVGMTFHALHNFGAALSGARAVNIAISLATDSGGIVIVVVILVLALRQERRLISEELREEIGILISEAEYQIALSPRLRLRRRWRALRAEGYRGSRRVGRYYQLLVELAFRLRRYRTGRASAKDLRAIPHLRERIVSLRPQVPA